MANPLAIGVTPSGQGLDGVSWNVVGHTYTPILHSENAFMWHAVVPDGTFVPPHIHPTQDEWIYMLDGNMEVEFGGDVHKAWTGRHDPHANGHRPWRVQPVRRYGHLPVRRRAIAKTVRSVRRA